jgi:N-acetylmuramoyl-L-alanine amidase
MAGDTEYIVQSGDCLSSIAVHHGMLWQTIWDYGPNAALKAKRKDPNVLYVGDKVVIPPKGTKKKNGGTDQKHRYKRKGEPSKLRVVLQIDGKPLKDKEYEVLFDEDQKKRTGATDGNGRLEEWIPGHAKWCKIVLRSGGEKMEYRLRLGELDPYDTLTGVQQRLNNLGFHCGAEDGVMGPRTERAVRDFQRAHKPLTVDGIPGSQTQNKLKELHGS